MHQIWVITDKNGKIHHCWEAPDFPNPENPNECPITLKNMPSDWHNLKVSEPSDFKNIKEKAKKNCKSISRYILEEYDADVKTKKLKKKKEQ